MMRTRRTTAAQRVAALVVGVLTALPLVGVALVTSATPASASTYRYWTYWWGTDTGKPHTGWKFASQGPASHGVADGWVLGWRFATSSVAGGKAPRVSATYSSLCHTAKPTDGSVRVALVIDYGTASDAPPGEKPPTTASVRVECLVLSSSARGTAAFTDATPRVVVRADNGLICGLDGYPRSECAPVIADPTSTPTPKPSAAPTRTVTPTPTTTTGAGSSSRPATTSSTPAGSRSASPTTSAPLATSAAPTASSSASPASTEPGATGSGSSDEATLPAVAGAPVAGVTEESSTGPLGVVAGVLVVGGLAGSAWWTSRRGGRAT